MTSESLPLFSALTALGSQSSTSRPYHKAIHVAPDWGYLVLSLSRRAYFFLSLHFPLSLSHLSHSSPPYTGHNGETVAHCSLFCVFKIHRKLFSWGSVQVSSFCPIKTSLNLAFHLHWWLCRCPSHACDAPSPSNSSALQALASTWPWEHIHS